MTVTLIPPDPQRRIEIHGVSQPVSRPVDIDQSLTGFTTLKTLRIYRFDGDSTIDGHAEEDEVYLIVLAGTIELEIESGGQRGLLGPKEITAPEDSGETLCAAYLPPGASYKLSTVAGADVAYARATPANTCIARFIESQPRSRAEPLSVLLEDTETAERLSLRLTRISAGSNRVKWTPALDTSPASEALLHFAAAKPYPGALIWESEPALQPIEMNSWDTLAISAGTRPTVEFPAGWQGLALLVTSL